MSYTELRQNLAQTLHEAYDSRAPLLIKSQGGKPNVVLLAGSHAATAGALTAHDLPDPADPP
jgi:PHD/YefM family antitoxin component YafN of YafNO toxin-antitoxin module